MEDYNGSLVLNALALGNVEEARRILQLHPDCEFGLTDDFILGLFNNHRVRSFDFLINEIDCYQNSSNDSEYYLAVINGNMDMIKFWINRDLLYDNGRKNMGLYNIYLALLDIVPNPEINNYLRTVLA